jgi:hypothetical protein
MFDSASAVAALSRCIVKPLVASLHALRGKRCSKELYKSEAKGRHKTRTFA